MNTRKQIAFDLNAEKNSPLYKYFKNTASMYYQLSKFFEENNFIHEQKSVYSSAEPMSQRDFARMMDQMCKKMPWLSECTKAINVTEIGKTYQLDQEIKNRCSHYGVARRNLRERIEKNEHNPQGAGRKASTPGMNADEKRRFCRQMDKYIKAMDEYLRDEDFAAEVTDFFQGMEDSIEDIKVCLEKSGITLEKQKEFTQKIVEETDRYTGGVDYKAGYMCAVAETVAIIKTDNEITRSWNLEEYAPELEEVER